MNGHATDLTTQRRDRGNGRVRRLPKTLGRMERCNLKTALVTLGIDRRKLRDGSRGYAIHLASEAQLYDWLETARGRYRQLMREHHPDAGGTNEAAAQLSQAWKRVQELLKRRGIEFA